ncbi:X-ray radiation resistance-associated protein 1-like isoform X2 [Clytia hemisphaerica]|uniref:X-ray radiation resistance-associated protein 1-like isoform X2 n=1 Tax=Clytia hemisphaerica TaxID=252671 RepID=UPI0034D4CA90
MQSKFYATSDEVGDVLNLPPADSRYTYQCFPVRNPRFTNDGGAWLVEYQAAKQNELKRKFTPQYKEKINKKLTGFFLVNDCYVDKPEDICILNISGKNLVSVNNEDFKLFKNIVHIDASDNQLSLESFKTFPSLENLDLQVNNIKHIKAKNTDFVQLKRLDLSYNNLSHDAMLNLGRLRNVQELLLRGCNLKSLPPQLARGYQVSQSDAEEKRQRAEEKTRFPKLISLDLSENNLTDISTFASLAGLRRLRILNLSCNKISGVPHLRLMAAHRHFSMSTLAEEGRSNYSLGVRDENTPHLPISGDGSGRNSKNSKCSCGSDMAGKGTPDNSLKSERLNTGDTPHDEMNTTIEKNGDNEEVSGMESTREEEQEETGNQGESSEQDAAAGLLDGLEDVISAISSNKDVEETNELLNLDFAQELNFRLNSPDAILTTPTTTKRVKASDMVHVDRVIPGTPSLNDDPNGDDVIIQDPFISDEHSAKDLLGEELKIPFACLTSLDLSYNHISEEESLLAVTSWPLLHELKLWGNPLTRSSKGIPHVLHHHLKVMCGINIVRDEPRPIPRQIPVAPVMALTTKAHRVEDKYIPIKRNDMAAIENMIQQAIENKSITDGVGGGQGRHENENENVPASSNVVNDEEKGGEGVAKQDSDDTFFLTQIDEEGVSSHDAEQEILDAPKDYEEEENDHTNKLDDELGLVELTDYDSLLELNDEDLADLVIPDSVQGSVAALRHVLRNELVFKSGHHNHKKKQNNNALPNLSPVKNRNEVENALQVIRNANTSHQENLAVVLDKFDDKESGIHKKFPDANHMMSRVQKRYDYVRSKSLRPLSETRQKLKECSTRSEPNSQELVMSRMRKVRIGDFYSPSRGTTPHVKIRGTRFDKVTPNR